MATVGSPALLATSSTSWRGHMAGWNRHSIWKMGIVILLLAVIFALIFAAYYAVMASSNVVTHFSVDFKGKAVNFSFAKHFQSRMVLQQAPQRANIYGFSSDIGATIALEVITSKKVYHYETIVKQGAASKLGYWSVKLRPMKTNESVLIRAKAEGVSHILEDVIFGDVWICSGQSNMEFKVHEIIGAKEVIKESLNYPNVRFMAALQTGMHIPLSDLVDLEIQWSSPQDVGVSDFSAVCWLYGKAIHAVLGYPIGLVGSYLGGSPVAAWSSGEALAKCEVGTATWSRPDPEQLVSPPDSLRNTDNSVLWNAMVHPLLGMTISGVIWYQGEQDSHEDTKKNNYNCSFPAMIDDWRLQFNKASSGETNNIFPFGFVQLAPSMPPYDPGFPDIRWHQTADYGYVPNERLVNVFMATALDLPDFEAPRGPIHPRHKLEIGSRLALSGLAVAYNKQEVFQGPFPVWARLGMNSSLVVDYGTQWRLHVRSSEGFELMCTSGSKSTVTSWEPTVIISNTSTQVTLQAAVCSEGQQILGLRYAWTNSPCALKMCAVYSTINELPAPPFVSFIENVHGKPEFQFGKQTWN
ncbi:unnamed protein product [Candidula unifasciata]|uniref:Sialate O-acetylesterase domain-containing protein n=1 Tax=Candidula unifasciata TaxID=100452 RepID=A0A8S3Z763_9EUPU|nr:unnamed protein product [Candidula unifasciata]